MRRTLTIILSAAAIAGVCFGAVSLARAAEEQQSTLPAEFTDVSTIATVEVRDAGGRVILQGTFAGTPEANGDLERKAQLAATDGSAASGEAEIEIERSKSGALEIEVELDVAKLGASTAYGFFLDGRQAALFTTDAKGEAEIELAPAAGK